ncbi:MAG: AzlD domain-containing protein [Clostridia bacterium]|nr:AzlD domain-containing protein [Clostridia bacterium]
MSSKYLIISILIMAAITAAIRFLPFAVFSSTKTPKIVIYLGKVLPYAIMGMLVVYCLKGVGFASAADFLPELIAAVLVVISYVIGKNTLVSIILGTLCYMILVQFVFI